MVQHAALLCKMTDTITETHLDPIKVSEVRRAQLVSVL